MKLHVWEFSLSDDSLLSDLTRLIVTVNQKGIWIPILPRPSFLSICSDPHCNENQERLGGSRLGRKRCEPGADRRQRSTVNSVHGLGVDRLHTVMMFRVITDTS